MIKIAALLKEFQLKISKSQFGLHEIINEPTHILKNSSLRIDLISTSQPNLSVESGIRPHRTLTVTIRLFTPNLIFKSFTHHLTLARIQMLILSDDPLMNFTWIEILRISM